MVRSLKLLWVGGLLVALAAIVAAQDAAVPAAIPPAAPKSTHFMVQVVKKLESSTDTRLCVGSLVSLKLAVTVGDCVSVTAGGVYYCVRSDNPSDTTVYTGTDVLWRYGVNGTLHNVTACRRHPKYATRQVPGNFGFDYDVAVVRLAVPVSVGNLVATVGLPAVSTTSPKAGTAYTLAGWGVYNWGEQDEDTPSNSMTTHAVKVLDKAQCKTRMMTDITANEFCIADAPALGRAGSALYSSNNVLHGLMSRGSSVATDLSNAEIQSFVRDMMRTL